MEQYQSYTLLFSFVVAISTVFYAILTAWLVSETIKMRKVQTEPKIAVTTTLSNANHNLVNIVIENIGQGPAYNIKFSVSPDFDYAPEMKFSDVGFIRNGISYFAPGQRLVFFLESLIEYNETIGSDSLVVEVTYDNSSGESNEEKFIIDLSDYLKMMSYPEGSLLDISEHLKGIKKDVHQLVDEQKKLNVFIKAQSVPVVDIDDTGV